jgi:hypothetical protein
VRDKEERKKDRCNRFGVLTRMKIVSMKEERKDNI